MTKMVSENIVPEVKARKKVFFPNLDGLRALAAFMVFVWHTELHKHNLRTEEIQVVDLGFMGVTIFLVLSGFLITYLLLQEDNLQGKISYRSFYMRRILRIWPLYFLVLFFGFFVYPANMGYKGLWMSAVFLSNFAIVLQLLPTIIDPVWSLGMEEQFYLFQPHMMRIKNKKNILWLILSLLTLIQLMKFSLKLVFPHVGFFITLKYYLAYFRYDSLLMGALTGLLFFNYQNKLFPVGFSLRFLLNKVVQWVSIVYVVAYVIFGLHGSQIIFNNGVLSIVTGIIIINLCSPETSVLNLQNKVMAYMGKISYGFYLLHKLPLFLMLYLTEKYMSDYSPLLKNSILYGCSFVGAVLLASLSFKYYESYFLRYKNKFSKI